MGPIRSLALFVLLALPGALALAAEPAPLPPMAGANGTQLKERAALFAELKAAKNEADARPIERKIWKFWLSFADADAKRLFEQSRRAQLRGDFHAALVPIETIVVHSPRFAEGWNQLGYVLFLAGNYDAALIAIEKALELEPMHYAALAGRTLILIHQGKNAEAQVALKKALAIDPWLRERKLLDLENGRKI